jgi:hypothetical protein
MDMLARCTGSDRFGRAVGPAPQSAAVASLRREAPLRCAVPPRRAGKREVARPPGAEGGQRTQRQLAEFASNDVGDVVNKTDRDCVL